VSAVNPDILNVILESLRELLAQKNFPVPASLGPDTVFLHGELPIDSLDLAVFLLVLEEKIGHDPFRDGFRAFVTVADLAAIYSA
jgi:acyl carrier protein